MTGVVVVAVAVIGFLLGSIPFGLLLTRAAGLGDIRRVGSGNIGATNVLRTGRKGLAAGTLLLDAAKGALAVAVGFLAPLVLAVPGAAAFAPPVAAVASVLGHCFCPWLGGRGGKGLATAFGAALVLSWLVAAIAGVVWLAVVLATRMSSAGALSALVVGVIAAFVFAPVPVALALLVIAAVVVLRHAANIRRIIAGTEPRFGRRV